MRILKIRVCKLCANIHLNGNSSAGLCYVIRQQHKTIGAAFVAKAINVGGRNVMLGIWDTAGSERYEAMSRIYYRGAKAAIVCYDLTDRSSFERVKFWVNELQNFEEVGILSSPSGNEPYPVIPMMMFFYSQNCRIYVCGTKSDLVEYDKGMRQVDFHDVQDYADEIKAHLCETSSKTGQSVDELFQKVAEDYVNYSDFHVQSEPKGVDLNSRRDLASYACCNH
ncbi:unnamed protein product [Ranitomeya imitator]|uniref:Ras-related protein Rab-24 n=1 Tax=Ranitomeya imitator TaxID=111125 RepID=A0ABN9LYA3_9NEOB|nr:unnamed protein product [Ranitomeya imitator]